MAFFKPCTCGLMVDVQAAAEAREPAERPIAFIL
jgi:hypothetical protein